jgi:nucleoside-diphosphate-sugar epimerase
MMSSGSKSSLDVGMIVNINETRNVLEALRHTCLGVRVNRFSSQAVYGQLLTNCDRKHNSDTRALVCHEERSVRR